MTPNEFAELSLRMRPRLIERSLSDLEQLIANRVLDYSYELGVPAARFRRLNYLCAVCGHAKNKISPALARLEEYEIVRVDRREGRWDIEFCANPTRWLVPLRVRPTARRQAELVDAWLCTINAPGMVEQPELWPPEPTLDDALYEVYRESAIAPREEDEINWADPAEVRRRARESLRGAVPLKGTAPPGSSSPEGNSEDFSLVVPLKGTPIAIETGTGQALACLLPVQEPVPLTGTGTGNRPAMAGRVGEQIDRLERILETAKYSPWWRKHAGVSLGRIEALRLTLDDYATNRESVRDPSRWLVKTFKNKCRELRH